MYKVIEFFTDLHDQDYPYKVGDTFPRAGIKVTEERIKELLGSNNRRGKPLIEEVKDEAEKATRESTRKAVEKPAEK